MRALIANVDDQGHSCLVEEREVTFDPRPGSPIDNTAVWMTDAGPAPAGSPGPAPTVDMALPPGTARWLALQFPPGVTAPLHHTQSLDLVFVFEGSAELILDDGPHTLGPGDFVVLNGVDHGWKAGPDGCRMSSVVIGAAPAG
jgi:quercetin dioxygenase-like cupin family protein